MEGHSREREVVGAVRRVGSRGCRAGPLGMSLCLAVHRLPSAQRAGSAALLLRSGPQEVRGDVQVLCLSARRRCTRASNLLTSSRSRWITGTAHGCIRHHAHCSLWDSPPTCSTLHPKNREAEGETLLSREE